MDSTKLPYKTKRLVIKGIGWEYISVGSGKRILLIFPGGGQDAQSTWRLIQEFERDYRVIAITIYQCSSISNLVDAVMKILQREKPKEGIVLYGLSIGALMAQSFMIRKKDVVDKLIISHGCTPQSATYKRKVILPLMISKLFLPIIPNLIIKQFLKLSGKVQGGTNMKSHTQSTLDATTLQINNQVHHNFVTKYWNKTLIKTWIDLHLDFYRNEKFTDETFKDWNGKVLILRTDNDPLMQDEGWFKTVYPKATVHTFEGTGHLTYYYQFENMIRVMRTFLK